MKERFENWVLLFDIQWRWFSLPDLKNPAKNRQAQLLWRIMWGLVFSSWGVVAITLLFPSGNGPPLILAGIILVASFFHLTLLRYGKLKLTIWIFLSITWAFLAGLSLVSWGVQPIMLFGETLVIFMAIFLLGDGAGLLYFSLSLALLILLEVLPVGWQRNLGLFPSPVIIPFWLNWLWYTVVGVLVIALARNNLLSSLAATQKMEKRFRSLFEGINDAVFIITFDLRIYGANHRACQLLGHDVFDLMRMGLDDIFNPEDFDLFVRVRDQIMNEHSVPMFETTAIHADGHLVAIEASVGAVRDEDNQPQYFQMVARDITERKKLQSRVQRSLNEMTLLARTDSLTGLLNRRAMQEMGEILMERAKDAGKPISVVMIDMDNLKPINDQYGHYAGDQALLHLSSVLQNEVGENDHAARWGGDEFLVIVNNEDITTASYHAEYWLAQITSKPLLVDVNSFEVQVSMGVATFDPETQDMDLKTLVQLADKALYSVKGNGKNNVGQYIEA